MATMKAVLVSSPGGADKLHIGDYQKPSPSPDELLVNVKATALNRADILQRLGRYPPPAGDSEILGLEMSGIVEQVGKNCEGKWKFGERVFGLLGGGGYAQHCVLPSNMAMKVPENMDWESAAAIPEAYLTAFQSLHWLGELDHGKKVLIHAGASGVGLAAIQLVKQFKDTVVIVTAGSAEKIEFCKSYGADFGINYKEEKEFSVPVLKATSGKGVDILLDFVGGPYWSGERAPFLDLSLENLKCLGVDSVMIHLGQLSGPKAEEFSMAPILRNRIHIKGSTLRARSPEYKAKLTAALQEYSLERFADGRLKPVVDKVFNWADVAQAHQYMEANLNKGKIVLNGMN